MVKESLWHRFDQLVASEESATTAAIATEASESHLLVKGRFGEPMFLLRCEERKTPRAPIRLKHVSVTFDVPFEVRLTAKAPPVTARYTKFTCSPESSGLHRWFVELVSAVTRRFAGPLMTKDIDEVLGSMLELFRQVAPPTLTTVTGLWGELLIIYLAIDRGAFVQAWHSTPTEVFDFSFPDLRLEVKTTQKITREHEIALSQVSSGRRSDFLLSVVVLRSTGGLSVLDLAKAISDTLNDVSAERFWRIVMETLGVELDGVDELRFDLAAARNSVKAFQADQIPAPIIPTEWQSVVTNVHFSVSLGAIGDGVPVASLLGCMQAGNHSN